MPFLAAIPAGLSALGIGGSAMATAASIAGGLSGALGLAQGIAQKDPIGAVTGALSGAMGGLGAANGLGNAAASAIPQAAEPIAQQAPDLVSALQAPAGNYSDYLSAVKSLEPAATGMSLGQKVGKGLEIANALGSTAAGIYGSLQDNSPSSGRMSLPGLDTAYPSAVGANASQLPGIEIPNVQMPELDLGLKQNKNLLELLGAFQV